MLLPVVAVALGGLQGGLALFQYQAPGAALSIAVMGSVVALLTFSMLLGYEAIRRGRAAVEPGSDARVRFAGVMCSLMGPILLGMWTTSFYYGRGLPLLPSLAIAILTTVLTLAIMLPLAWWLLSRVDRRIGP